VILIGELEANVLSLEMLQEEITNYLRFAAKFSELINDSEIDSEKINLTRATNGELLRA
jgi:hypothetical protein